MIHKSNSRKFLIICMIMAVSFLFSPVSRAEIILDTLELTLLTISPDENTAEIVWDTSYPTWGRIHYGTTTAFGSWIENTAYLDHHQMALSGLTEDTKYYFKLEAYDSYDRQLTSSIWNFTTEEENDITPPILTNVQTPFVGGNHVQFVWETDESSTSCVYYGTNMNNLDKHKCNNSKVLVHDLVIDNLIKYTFYYYRAYSKDSENNGAYSVYYNFKTDFFNDTNLPALEIYQTNYSAATDQEGQALATITFQTNRPVEGKLRWGTKSGSYNKKVYLAAPRSTNNQVVITDLEPDSVYYHILELKDVVGQELDSEEYIFITPVLGSTSIAVSLDVDYNPSDPDQDFDQDGLTNGEEELYGTSPIKSDSDGDGYVDGVEVRNGYSPLGQGKLSNKMPQVNSANAFTYGLPRVSSLQIEVNSANELKYELELLFKGSIPVSLKDWPTLVNAFVYGGYPVQAIYQAIIFGGKTVHPTIPWSAWQNSADYQKYINK